MKNTKVIRKILSREQKQLLIWKLFEKAKGNISQKEISEKIGCVTSTVSLALDLYFKNRKLKINFKTNENIRNNSLLSDATKQRRFFPCEKS
jgi:hypothetical protein